MRVIVDDMAIAWSNVSEQPKELFVEKVSD